MNHEYLIGVRLATPNPDLSINQNPYKDVILSAINEYNLRSQSAPNPKCIELVETNFSSDSFIVRLKSEKELASAGKALRVFSQIVAKSNVFSTHIKNGKVFTTFPVMETAEECTILDPDKISDTEIVKALIDYICNKSDTNSTTYKRKRSAMAQIKQIALEAGIYTIKS